MIHAFESGLSFSPDRWRIDRYVLRLLDSDRAELRVCAAHPDAFASTHMPRAAGADSRTTWDDDEHDDERGDDDAFFESTDAPQAWTAVIPIESLPAGTREVLQVARGLYEIDELDLSASADLEQLLLALRATTWAPEPVRMALH